MNMYEEMMNSAEFAPLMEQLKQVMSDEHFANAVNDAPTADAFRSLFASKGIEMDEAAAAAAFSAFHQVATDELDESALDEVAGGFATIIVGGIIIGACAGVVAGVCCAKLYEIVKYGLSGNSCSTKNTKRR